MSNKVPRSRILIIGKANAGKTSILKKICGDADIPIVHDRNGKRVIALESLDPTTGRGLHNVENEITYPSSPQFAFHDSRGIEAASITEINRLADFISRRGSSAMSWEQRLHATWICLPLDDERPLSEAEMRMITLNPDEVPVVVVFTKYDGLETRAFNKIHREGGMSLREAYRAMKGAAERLFKEQWLERIYPTEPPKPPFVRLKDLHKPEGSCEELMQCTENVLKNNQPAHKMFILAQKYKLEKRLKHALPDAIKFLLGEIGHRGQDSLDDLVKRVLTWMPHVYQRTVSDSIIQACPDLIFSLLHDWIGYSNHRNIPDSTNVRIVDL
ncbi:hypothetical protein FRB95_010181 [Tulasnella sp. JGI-2019a]|nr:hypothetical protein FRB95_010181 [Tulasnella sp. JGI-2019a]